MVSASTLCDWGMSQGYSGTPAATPRKVTAAPVRKAAAARTRQCGSFTTVTKKLSIWRITSMKRSKSTGLLT